MAFVTLATEDKIDIVALDAEHKRMVEMVEALYNSMIPGMSDSCYAGLFQSLLDAAETHFRHEEATWNKTGYPGAEEHQRHHAELRQLIEQYRDAITDRSDPQKSRQMMEFLKSWVMNHIQSDDRGLGIYLKEHGLIKEVLH